MGNSRYRKRGSAQDTRGDATDSEEPPGPDPDPPWPSGSLIPCGAAKAHQTIGNNCRVTTKTQQRPSGNAQEPPRRPPEARGWVTPPSNTASTRVQSGQTKIARSWPHTSWHARDNDAPADARASRLNEGPWSRKEVPELARGRPSLRASDNSADGRANQHDAIANAIADSAPSSAGGDTLRTTPTQIGGPLPQRESVLDAFSRTPTPNIDCFDAIANGIPSSAGGDTLGTTPTQIGGPFPQRESVLDAFSRTPTTDPNRFDTILERQAQLATEQEARLQSWRIDFWADADRREARRQAETRELLKELLQEFSETMVPRLMDMCKATQSMQDDIARLPSRLAGATTTQQVRITTDTTTSDHAHRQTSHKVPMHLEASYVQVQPTHAASQPLAQPKSCPDASKNAKLNSNASNNARIDSEEPRKGSSTPGPSQWRDQPPKPTGPLPWPLGRETAQGRPPPKPPDTGMDSRSRRHATRRKTFGDPDASPGHHDSNQSGGEDQHPHTPAGTTANDGGDNLRQRIYNGIKNAISSIVDRPKSVTKSVATPRNMATPTYGGDDDIETFMRWLNDFLNSLDTLQPMGEIRNHHRITAMQPAMKGPAKTWFDTLIRSGDTPKFLNMLCSLTDAFISPAAATKAEWRFKQIFYSRQEGINVFIQQLRETSQFNLILVTENSLRSRIIEAIPRDTREAIIHRSGLSVSTSSVVEWRKLSNGKSASYLQGTHSPE